MANDKNFKVKNGVQAVFHENVGTVVSGTTDKPYGDVSGWSYSSKSKNVISEDTSPRGADFKTDGTKMYVLGNNTNAVYQYSLSTAWDVSTASYDSVSFSISSQTTNPYGIQLRPDGTNMYIVDGTGDQIEEYALSTAWDLSTASHTRSESLTTADATPRGCTIIPDGTKMFMAGLTNDKIYEWTMSTPWNTGTLNQTGNASDEMSTVSLNPFWVIFNGDGTKMYYWTSTADVIYQYTLSTAYSLQTATYDGVYYDPGSETVTIYGARFGNDGYNLYLGGQSEDSIFQYNSVSDLQLRTLNMSTGTVFNVTSTEDTKIALSNPASSGTISQATMLIDGSLSEGYILASDIAYYESKSKDVSTEVSSLQGGFFKSDGTKMYVVDSAGSNSVYQYALSTADDVSTASYESKSFSFTTQDGTPEDVFFKSDGTKMYMLGRQFDTIFQYSLSTAWDVSTASYDSVSLSVTSQDTAPQSLFFKPDGTKVFITGTGVNRAIAYDLTTAWDVSTASYNSEFFILTSQTNNAKGIEFNSDGNKMFITESQNDAVHVYALATAWNVSTASYTNVALDVSSQDLTPEGGRFNSDGKKLYMFGGSSETVYQYSTATASAITYDDSVQFPGGTAPSSPANGETDVLTFTTRDGGTSYQGILAIDGAK